LKTLRNYRFELYLITYLLFLFGSLFFPSRIFEAYINPLLVLANITAGFLLISMRRRSRRVYAIIFVLAIGFSLLQFSHTLAENLNFQLVRFSLISLFYTLVTLEIILQVWHTREVNKNVIFGVMGGYVSLGLIAFFLLKGILITEPDAYRGLEGIQGEALNENLIYYSYITLMTIGYGDIVPVTPLAQKAAVLIGLGGQFYLVIITAVVVGKYIGSQKHSH
jgi:voltage-gated potassium channel Kch